MLPCPAVAAPPNPLFRQGASEGSGDIALVPGCLSVIVTCVVVGVAALQALPAAPSGEPIGPRLFAGAIGLLGGLGLQSVYWLARGFGRGANSRAALIARAGRNTPPIAGEPLIATGVIRSERPLVSPLGQVECVAYDYRMYTVRSIGSGRPMEVPVYWGYAGQPFAIDAPSMRYPVASVPLLPGKATRLEGDDVVARARAYIRATGWETVELGMLGTMDTVFQRVGDDSRAGTRRDFALTFEEAPDVALLTLEESVLPVGATASAFGRWSATIGALVAPEGLASTSHVAIALGGPEALGTDSGVPHSTTSYVVTAIVLLLAAAGTWWLALRVIPTIH
jgi:hypothetical protein